MKCRNLIVGIVALLLTVPGVTQAASFLEDEAGISASTHVASVDLDLAATAFKNIEQKTAGYIIGSVTLIDYSETHDVHVYLDGSGDMIAYYFKQEQASKIIDWKHDPTGSLSGSKLEDALAKVCDAMSVVLGEVKYYDFRYPEATNIKIITDEALKTTDTFRFMIPGNHVIYNSSWSHAAIYNSCCSAVTSQFKFDSVLLNQLSTKGWAIAEGEISVDQIVPDIYHDISIYASPYGDGYVAIVLQYSITP